MGAGPGGRGARGVRRGGAAVALPRAPVGGHRHGGLHPDRLVGPGAPDRADVADPDRRLRRGRDRAAVRPGQRDRHHGVVGRRPGDLRARAVPRPAAGRRADPEGGRDRGRCDVSRR